MKNTLTVSGGKIQPGMWVYERGSSLSGVVVGPGEHPEEWRVRTANGGETFCLEENLQVYSSSQATQSCVASFFASAF